MTKVFWLPDPYQPKPGYLAVLPHAIALRCYQQAGDPKKSWYWELYIANMEGYALPSEPLPTQERAQELAEAAAEKVLQAFAIAGIRD